MRKLFLLGIIFLMFLFSVNSICCDKGCYLDANICCGPQGQTVGVEGCYNANTKQYLCPGNDFRIGECLICGENSEWVEDTEGLAGCNACVVEYDLSNNPIDSTCDYRCPEGEVMCEDGVCRESCGGSIDSDNDGLPDAWEELYFGNLEQNGSGDYDNDGISNLKEYLQGTDPTKKDTDGDGKQDGTDTDGDGMTDDWEENHGLDPNDPNDADLDPDKDGFTNLEEYQNGTDPNKWDGDLNDTDKDGLPDAWEELYFGNLEQNGSGDYDNDGVSNLEEYLQGTDPTKKDTDGDGKQDGKDTDGDGMTDDWEENHGLDPNDPNDANLDPDGDGFTNLEEYQNGTDPNKWEGEIEGGAACNNNGECDEGDSCQCGDCDYLDLDSCLEGLMCSEERKLCSGDLDGDEVLNDDDVCLQIADPDQKDEDGDCYLANGKRSPMFGYCGDECEGEFGSCESVYGDKQCCDNFPGAKGGGQFFGFTEDCPVKQNGIGCWSDCFKMDGNDKLTYESGACIDDKRVIKEFRNGVESRSWEEDCMGIPLVPFFTNFNVLVTVLILAGYYIKRNWF